MQKYHVKYQAVDKKKLIGVQPVITSSMEYVDKDALIYDSESGELLALYKIIDLNTAPLAKELKGVKYQSINRSGGITTNSVTFGYSPRLALRRDYCMLSKLSTENPLAHKQLLGFTYDLVEYYKTYFPELYKAHLEKAKVKIKERWMIKGTPFTSGIVNYNSAIKYHYDAGNIRECASNMLLLVNNIEGADLVFPEYNIAFKTQDNALYIFDGQGIMHGVTKLKLKSRASYRISVVYYTLEQMWQCLSPQEEIARANKIKTVRQVKKGKPNDNGNV